eukprot:4146572-Pyramimonas_sp.AAC.1
MSDPAIVPFQCEAPAPSFGRSSQNAKAIYRLGTPTSQGGQFTVEKALPFQTANGFFITPFFRLPGQRISSLLLSRLGRRGCGCLFDGLIESAKRGKYVGTAAIVAADVLAGRTAPAL